MSGSEENFFEETLRVDHLSTASVAVSILVSHLTRPSSNMYPKSPCLYPHRFVDHFEETHSEIYCFSDERYDRDDEMAAFWEKALDER
jgi:hypothetical protein